MLQLLKVLKVEVMLLLLLLLLLLVVLLLMLVYETLVLERVRSASITGGYDIEQTPEKMRTTGRRSGCDGRRLIAARLALHKQLT